MRRFIIAVALLGAAVAARAAPPAPPPLDVEQDGVLRVPDHQLAGAALGDSKIRGCAVAYGGISDMNTFLSAAIPGDDDRSATGRYLRQFTGSRSGQDPAMTAISPARLAARADAPVLLIHGADDSVVSIVESQEMERALRAAGKPVEFVVMKGEDHWLSRDATRKAMLAASVDFVEKYNPPQ